MNENRDKPGDQDQWRNESKAYGAGPMRILFTILVLIFLLVLTMGTVAAWKWLSNNKGETILSSATVNEVAIFSPVDRRIVSSDFRSGTIVTIFGDSSVNMADAVITSKGADLKLIAIFGGIQVTVPSEWQVTSNGIAIFGKFSNETRGGTLPLAVSGGAIFGSIEIVEGRAGGN